MVLETLVVDGDVNTGLTDRSLCENEKCFLSLCRRTNQLARKVEAFTTYVMLDVATTTLEEQRRTDW